MSNSKNYLNGLELEKEIKGMTTRELVKFNVRTTHQLLIECAERDKDIKELQKGDKKRGSVSGGITGAIAGVVIGVINYFTTRGGA